MELHAVLVSNRLPIDEAKRISKDFIPASRNYYRTTAKYYRFRNIPKQRFRKQSFRSKKINDDITLIYGEIL